MIEANAVILEGRLRKLSAEADAVANKLRTYLTFTNAIGISLTAQQKANALAALNVGNVASSYSDAVDAFTATDPIVGE